MKNRIIFSLANIILGVLLILVPTVLLKPCSHEEMKMACYYTSRAEIGIGAFIIFLGVATALAKGKEIRTGISIALLGAGILAIAFPLKLTGLCGMSSMACHVKTLPGIVVVSVLLEALSIINIVFLTGFSVDRAKTEGKRQYLVD